MENGQRQAGLFGGLTQRSGAEQYLLLTIVSFAASVSLTRLFLTITGYPQLGGGQLHIAHVLWGGLLLYIAALLPLLFADRSVLSTSAILAGAGVGLFIDEVGKFITSQNDYFYPASAAIIYLLFLLTIAVYLRTRRAAHQRGRDELARLFEETWDVLHRPTSPTRWAQLRERLDQARLAAPSAAHAGLATALTRFLPEPGAPTAAPTHQSESPDALLRRFLGRMEQTKGLQVLLVVGLTAVGLLNLKNPATALLGDLLPAGALVFLANLHMGRQVMSAGPALWGWIRVGLEIAVGVLLLTSAALIAFGRRRSGAAVAYVGLLLSLTTVDILLFYFEQFSTIITTIIQFLLLLGVLIYRRRPR